MPPQQPRTLSRYAGALAFAAVLCMLLVAFALVHLRLEVPHEWHGWIVLAVIAPIAYVLLDRLGARLRRPPQPRRTREPPAAAAGRATSGRGSEKKTASGR